MSTTLLRFSAHFLIFGLLYMAGCSSAPTLDSKSSVVPAGVDLTGYWLVRSGPKFGKAANMDATGGQLFPMNRSYRSRRQRSRGGASAQVFLEYGETLKITQTGYGLFISYDRSIVEEYRFGENREVSIGPIEATRVSGWEGKSFVAETLDDTGTTLFEAWRLEENDTVLIRNIHIRKGGTDSFAYEQVFDRR